MNFDPGDKGPVSIDCGVSLGLTEVNFTRACEGLRSSGQPCLQRISCQASSIQRCHLLPSLRATIPPSRLGAARLYGLMRRVEYGSGNGACTRGTSDCGLRRILTAVARPGGGRARGWWAGCPALGASHFLIAICLTG